jgi:hypothetical protein
LFTYVGIGYGAQGTRHGGQWHSYALLYPHIIIIIYFCNCIFM